MKPTNFKDLVEERRQVCQHLVGRDDCEDVPGMVAAVLKERRISQTIVAEYRTQIEQLEKLIMIERHERTRQQLSEIERAAIEVVQAEVKLDTHKAQP